MTVELALGTQAESRYLVAEEHLALRWGSGAVAVLATPQMIGWMEETAAQLVSPLLPQGYYTVGTLVNVRHLAPSVPGAIVTVRAILLSQDDRSLTFALEANDDAGKIGEGTHQRYIINRERFEARARERAAGASSG